MTRFAAACLAILPLIAALPAHAVTVRAVQGPTGVEAWLAEEHALPMIAFDISLPAGSAYDPADKPDLKPADVITRVNGHEVTTPDEFYRAVKGKNGPAKLTQQNQGAGRS